MEAAAWGILGTAVGAAASIATTLLASRNSANLQLEAARLERLEKHRAFQRETLIELQDALHNELRSIALVYQADDIAFHQSGNWGSQLLGEDLNEKAHQTGRRRLLLTERVSDDQLREHIKRVSSLCTQVLLARDKRTAESAFHSLATEGNSAMERIGKVLRSLYSDGA